MKYCINCGEPLEESSEFCVSCGTPVDYEGFYYETSYDIERFIEKANGRKKKAMGSKELKSSLFKGSLVIVTIILIAGFLLRELGFLNSFFYKNTKEDIEDIRKEVKVQAQLEQYSFKA